jgi:hypothetical protein
VDATNLAVMEKMASEGATAREIADALGVTIHKVYDTAYARGIDIRCQHKPVTMPAVHQVRRLVAYGLSSEMIAAVIDRTKMSVDTIRQRHGIRRPQLPRTVATRVTQRCWDRLVTAAAAHGDAAPNRIAGITLELATDGRVDLLLAVLPPSPSPARPAGMTASLMQPMLSARAG